MVNYHGLTAGMDSMAFGHLLIYLLFVIELKMFSYYFHIERREEVHHQRKNG